MDFEPLFLKVDFIGKKQKGLLRILRSDTPLVGFRGGLPFDGNRTGVPSLQSIDGAAFKKALYL